MSSARLTISPGTGRGASRSQDAAARNRSAAPGGDDSSAAPQANGRQETSTRARDRTTRAKTRRWNAEGGRGGGDVKQLYLFGCFMIFYRGGNELLSERNCSRCDFASEAEPSKKYPKPWPGLGHRKNVCPSLVLGWGIVKMHAPALAWKSLGALLEASSGCLRLLEC